MDLTHPDIHRRGLMFVLSSPSGAGKTTLTKRLLAIEPRVRLSVSATTRAPRPREVPGEDYHFVSEEEFARLQAEDAFLEHAVVFEHLYGTLRAPVEESLSEGMDVLFDIDWQGAQLLTYSAESDVVRVFILPPSWEELERRLRARAQDSDEVVRRRMERASDEMSHWAEYDYIIVNRDLDHSLEQLRAILNSERLRRRRQHGMAEFVRTLRTQGEMAVHE
ncbi:MAG: guanylate kinase [Candidatus Puniceispirillum sp.]|nr:guanylate kinase [Candidatus Puniceispirillum sp.]MCA0370156.1 guanylate kinase [Pseudomonadota bacterium]